MIKAVEIKKNAYFDSVTLMTVSNAVSKTDGIKEALVAMATPINIEIMENIGLGDHVDGLTSNDLVIAVVGETEEACDNAIQIANDLIWNKKNSAKSKGEEVFYSIKQAKEADSELNLAVISIAGRYAKREVKAALESGMNVMLFSDNVTVEDELELKRMAHEKGLIVMGPDCGTSIINNVGLCFANGVRKGDIGLVAASGTGLQEVTVLIHKLGGGISQAIGTGGRDLSEAVGGITLLDGLSALMNDDNTQIIVLISKPPAKLVADKILGELKNASKPVVICFLGGESDKTRDGDIVYAGSLEDAAVKAMQLFNGESVEKATASIYGKKAGCEEKHSALKAGQKYIRALYCGGTLASEACIVMSKAFKNVYSNVAKKPENQMKDVLHSEYHAIVDLGDDMFTSGRPHPMIDPSIRSERIIKEASDPETAVLLLDFELGYGSHHDPVGVSADAIREARTVAEKAGRGLVFIAYLLGTELDFQGFAGQRKVLEDLGVIVCESNLQAVESAMSIVREMGAETC